ncbi:calmodulin [Trypanosoma rangeli]|uniref:Calmodulin n=1 Tax=Trypanosoma rangeli TaxID=5698 RepID=A0A422NXG8_TRYRA|nr:calmodulin [Trypanosoma rangeli]RNF10158.1 calmodulin [Trypanosoma rangeli]|eukprot:RNF10158.1 calmodulin [Trypanosoma rangeli]
MLQQELTDSIGQLESDLLALDRDASGSIPCRDFARVLLRNGGSREQVEALTEQFSTEGRECVRYAALLDSVRQLADGMTSPPLARCNDSGSAPRSAFLLSDTSDTLRGAGSTGFLHTRSRASATRPMPVREGNPRRNNPRHGAFVSAGDDKGPERFYSSRASTSVYKRTGLLAQQSAATHRFAISRHRSTGSAANRQEHRSPPVTGSGSRADNFVERVVGRASSPSYCTSSVERMLQTARECAFSGSFSSLASGGVNESASHGTLSKRKGCEVRQPSNREITGVGNARQIGVEGATVKQPNTGAKMIRNSTRRSLFQDTYLGGTVPPQDISRVSHGTFSSWLAGRGELISLREIFRVMDTDQDGILSLQEVWNSFSHRGIGISLLELDALADSLELDVSRASDVSSVNAGVSGDRVLNVADFCMLVSRMRSSLIERIRRAELWTAVAQECSPPPVPPAEHAIDSGSEGPEEHCRQGAENVAAMRRNQLPLMKPALYDLTSASQSPLSPPSPSSPPAEVVYGPKQQVLLHTDVNSFSPPPSVHTSVAVHQVVGSSSASTPLGRGTVAAAAEHQHLSGSPISVSPSPEMEEPFRARMTPTPGATIPSPPRRSNTVRASEVTPWLDRQQDSVLVTASMSQSPHPYDLPIERGLKQEIKLSLPQPYSHAAVDRAGVRLTGIQGVQPAPSTTCTRNAGKATGLVNNDYAMLHNEIIARQKQRMEEDEFLRQLEQEFQEKYGNLISEGSVERTEEEEERSPPPVNHQVETSETRPSNAIMHGAAMNTPREARRTRSASLSVGNEFSPGGGASDDSRVGGSLLRPTASSRAHAQDKKFVYCPPRRAASLSHVRGALIWKTGTQVRDGNTFVDPTLRRRSLSGGEEPVSMRARRHTVDRKRQQQQRSHAASPAVAHTTMFRGEKGKLVQGGDTRSGRLLPLPRNGVSALMHHHHSGGAADRPLSGLLGREGPGVVRVSLVASSGGGGSTSGVSSEVARSTSEGADARAQRHNPPMPGIPPRPPTHTSALEDDAGGANEAHPLELPQEISVKLYGRCSQLLSLCTNYDRLHDGYVSPKELGRALYTVAPNLTEGEINALVRVGIANGGDGARCHYTSLVGTLVVQESYVGLRDGAASDDETPTKAKTKVSPKGPCRAVAALPASEPLMNPATPRVTSRHVVENTEEVTLEERVRKGRLKMRRLLREELLGACDGDYHRLREAFFAYDDIRTGFLEEKVLRKCLVELFRTAQRVIPSWVMDRCIRMCRTPFEREMSATTHDDSDANDGMSVPKGRKTVAAAVMVPPPESPEEAAARCRVHGIPKLLWSVLCDYRYMLEELRL